MEQRDTWRQQLQGLLLVVVVAIALRWGVVEPRWIPSESMQPGLQPQDRILVWKLGHRLGLSPKRNAVVVFRTPEVLAAAGYDPNAALIKRVVGVALVMRLPLRAARCSATGCPSASPGSLKRWTINCRRRRCSRGNCWFWGITAMPALIPTSGASSMRPMLWAQPVGVTGLWRISGRSRHQRWAESEICGCC